jgi:hypothetical protein
MVLLGALDSSGVLDANVTYLLASMQEMVITIQSARADPTALSPVTVLRGLLQLPAPGTGEGAPTHSH